MYVLAIDLGLRTCGYVICKVDNLKIELVREGQIKPNPKESLPQKLHLIFTKLKEEIVNHNPKAVITEKLYSHYRHPTTLGVLAQVKGVIALAAYCCGVDYFEFSSTRARKALTGKGNVSSSQVKKMAENISRYKFKTVHTADAFSLVSAFSHARKFNRQDFWQKR